ncbi:MAG: DUF3486 family protein [Bryobacterales bacterium]|nr:DUF3486 family protein [Bryobacterales bacterium]
MGRPSTVNRLPENVREALHGWLNDPAITQEEATQRTNALLAEVAPEHPRVSYQAVNRYDRKFREVTRRLRESREVASRMVAELGSAPGGEMGRLLTEMVRTVSFRITAVIQETDLGEDAIPRLLKQLKDLSLISQRVEAAGKMNEQREREVRELARREAKEEAASAAEGTATRQGLSAETAAAIRRSILGLRDVDRNSVAAPSKAV